MKTADRAATAGTTVRLRYTIRLDSGKAYPPRSADDFLVVELGRGGILPGIERALEGMRAGDRKIVRVPADLAFGPRNPARKFRVSRDRRFGPGLRVGDAVRLSGGLEGDVLATVEEVSPSWVIVDANHPLAGEDLTFDIDVLDVVFAPREAALAC
jgi:peptidylprolyl isomerase